MPKVVIEAKWGTNAGEFKMEGLPWEEDFNTSFSLAVNSKGEIYILDIGNNRIQKFSTEGKYIKSISVPSWSGYKYYGYMSDDISVIPAEGEGINISIDSRDRLYYYFIKGRYKNHKEADKNKDGRVDYRDISKKIPGSGGVYGYADVNKLKNPEATGEVWEFKDDEFIARYKLEG